MRHSPKKPLPSTIITTSATAIRRSHLAEQKERSDQSICCFWAQCKATELHASLTIQINQYMWHLWCDWRTSLFLSVIFCCCHWNCVAIFHSLSAATRHLFALFLGSADICARRIDINLDLCARNEHI